MSDETIQGLRRRIGELDQLVRQLNQSGLDNARAQLLLARKRAELEDFINRGQRCQDRSNGTTHNADNPPWIKALAEVRIDAMLSGDVETGKTILRDYIKATVGFEKLGEATGTQPKSLIRMFGPRGNPQAKNLFSVLGYLQKRAGLELHVA